MIDITCTLIQTCYHFNQQITPWAAIPLVVRGTGLFLLSNSVCWFFFLRKHLRPPKHLWLAGISEKPHFLVGCTDWATFVSWRTRFVPGLHPAQSPKEMHAYGPAPSQAIPWHDWTLWPRVAQKHISPTAFTVFLHVCCLRGASVPGDDLKEWHLRSTLMRRKTDNCCIPAGNHSSAPNQHPGKPSLCPTQLPPTQRPAPPAGLEGPAEPGPPKPVLMPSHHVTLRQALPTSCSKRMFLWKDWKC